MFSVLSRQQAMDGLIWKRPPLEVAHVDVVSKRSSWKHSRREEQAAPPAPQQHRSIPSSSQAPTPTPPPPPSFHHSLSLSLSLSAHTRTVRVSVPCRRATAETEREKILRRQTIIAREKDRKRRFFASCTGYSSNKAAGREKISSLYSFRREILIPPSPSSTNHRRRQATTTGVAPAGDTSQRQAAGSAPVISREDPRQGPRHALNSGGGGDGVVQGARASRDAVPPGGRVARLGGRGALRGRTARLPPPRMEPRRRRGAAAPRAIRSRRGRLPRHVHRGALLHAPPHLRTRRWGQPGAPQRPRARRHAAHVLPPRRPRTHLPEHEVPAHDGGCVVPGICDSVYGGVPALLLPLNNSPGTGGLLPLPPGSAHWALCRLQRLRRSPPRELPHRPGQWHAYHPAGPVVLSDGVHALRVDAPRGVSPRC